MRNPDPSEQPLRTAHNNTASGQDRAPRQWNNAKRIERASNGKHRRPTAVIRNFLFVKTLAPASCNPGPELQTPPAVALPSWSCRHMALSYIND